MDRADDHGFLLMDDFSGEEVAEAGGPDVFLSPPPLPDSDWLAAVSHAVTTPVDAVRGEPGGADEIVPAGDEARGDPAAGTGALDELETQDWAPPNDAGVDMVGFPDAATDGNW